MGYLGSGQPATLHQLTAKVCGECCKLPQLSLGRSPGRQTVSPHLKYPGRPRPLPSPKAPGRGTRLVWVAQVASPEVRRLKRRMRKNRGAEGTEWGGGRVFPSQPTRGSGERRELPSGVRAEPRSNTHF